MLCTRPTQHSQAAPTTRTVSSRGRDRSCHSSHMHSLHNWHISYNVCLPAVLWVADGNKSVSQSAVQPVHVQYAAIRSKSTRYIRRDSTEHVRPQRGASSAEPQPRVDDSPAALPGMTSGPAADFTIGAAAAGTGETATASGTVTGATVVTDTGGSAMAGSTGVLVTTAGAAAS